MGEDQGDFGSWIDWGLYDDLNNDGDSETPTQTDLSAQASSIPVAASADPLGHPTVSFPSPDACEVSEPQCGPAAFDHTDLNMSDRLESNETASFAQMAQLLDSEEIELIDSFNHWDSQGPAETAGSSQLVQPPGSTEDETFNPVDFNSNSTIPSYATSDPHNLQEPTDDATSMQALGLEENKLFYSTDLDLGRSMALPEMALTSSEQPALPINNTMIVPTAASQSAFSAMPFDGEIFQYALDMASHPDAFASPSCGIDWALSIPGEESQSTSGCSLSQRRNYVAIRPKETETTQNTKSSSAQHSQDSSNVIRPSSEVVLATSATPSSVKGKRKRSQNFTRTQSGIPDPYTCVFQVSNSTAATRREQQQPPTKKRNRSAKACLRCQMQNLKVRRVF